MAATRQNEMNENITLLTTTTCAARPSLRPDHEPLESNDDAMEIAPGSFDPIFFRKSTYLASPEPVKRFEAVSITAKRIGQ